MKRLNTLAVGTGAALLSLAAHAQSSTSNVTVYGIADMFVQGARGDASLSRVQSGGLSGSRLGFRGTEDLGSGLYAIYTLEAGINIDDGSSAQGGVLFGRQAFVGLKSDLGQLTLGRQYSSIYTATADFSAFSNNVAGPSTAVIGGFANGYEPVRGAGGTATPPAAGATGNGGPARVNNSVRYETPSFAGFRAGALYGFGEVADATNDQRLIDLFARYGAGPVEAIVSYVTDRTVGVNRADVATGTIATAITLGSAHVFAGFMNVNDKGPNDLDGRGYWLGADYRILARHLVRAQYVINDPRTGNDNETRAFGVGYQYDFSRRTSFYSSLTRFDNQANAGVGGLGRWNAAIPTGLTSTSKNDITELVAGLRHTF
jgi:predicted porin